MEKGLEAHDLGPPVPVKKTSISLGKRKDSVLPPNVRFINFSIQCLAV